MSIRIEKASLLRHKNDAAKIGPFDGLVGCVIESGEKFVTSANQKYVPQPPLGQNRPLQLRTDFLYGEDDPIRWPQPFNPNYSHYSCILRYSPRRPEQIMWWKPDRTAFNAITTSHLPVTGLGKLDTTYCGSLELHVNALLIRAEAYIRKTPPSRVPPILGPMVQMVKHSLARLKFVAMNFGQMEFQVRDVQRSWLEVIAMLDYMEIYRPRMDGTTGILIGEPPKPEKLMGTFTSDLRMAQDHFQAGLPCWVIRPASAFINQNILEVCEPRTPQFIDLTVHRFRNRILAIGPAGTNEKYNAIHRQARNIMQYPNAFASGTIVNVEIAPGPSTSQLPDVASAVSSSIGPMRSRTEKGKKGLGRKNNRGHVPQIMPNAVQPGAGRNKFEPINSPLMPLPILSWENALKLVDTNSSNLDSSTRNNPCNCKYLFPEPGILAGVTNAVRQARYFETWKNTRAVCIYRAFHSSSAAIPLSNQEWCNFLLGNLNMTLQGQRNQEGQKKFREIFANCLDDLELDFSTFMPPPDSPLPPVVPEEAQKVLWELAELNFRFELLALDNRASDSLTDEETQDRQDLISRCFPGAAALIVVEPSHAAMGLASSEWRERLPCLLRLRTLMRRWKGHKPTPILLPDLESVDMYQEKDVQVLEQAIAKFYTQSFFNFFGRAPVIPMRLPPPTTIAQVDEH